MLQPLPVLGISGWESALAKIGAFQELVHGQQTLPASILPHSRSPLCPSCRAGWHQPLASPLSQAGCLPATLRSGLSHFVLPPIKQEQRLELTQRDAPGAQSLHQPLPARPAPIHQPVKGA